MSDNAPSVEQLSAETDRFRQELQAVRDEIEKAIIGQSRVIEVVLTALFCGGNVLLEGVPGLGKTELIKALSRVLDLEFRRIQFTPDLMPADIVGTNVLTADDTGESRGYRIEFRRGPIFTQLLLADEINRATPKTQSAMLETMQEKTVTVAGHKHELTPPFFVMATQNPLEQEGTYPLPEAQLDRFMFKVNVPFLNREDLNAVVARTILRKPVALRKVIDAQRIVELTGVLDGVVVADPVRDFACRLVLATHPDSEHAPERVTQYVKYGASPRAAQALVRAGRMRALAQGRAHAAVEDVRYFADEVLQHRILLNYDGQAEGITTPELIADALDAVTREPVTA